MSDEPRPADDVESLVQQAQDGDIDALNDLFLRYHQTMVEVARRKLGPKLRLKEDPDDLAQTTFREATRDQRMEIADRAQAQFRRTVSWGSASSEPD